MKIIVRIFALSLVATGLAASSHIANSSAQPTLGSKVSAWPVPVCPPGTADGCGIGGPQ